MNDNMYDLTGWQPVTCLQRDAIIFERDGGVDLHVFSSLTDLYGNYGTPVVYTELGLGDEPILRDYRYPPSDGSNSGPDARPCEHYIPSITDTNKNDNDEY